MHRQIAGKLTSPVTKWIVLAFWLLALIVGGFFGSKLVDEQNNEASSWLPGSAESTRALEKMAPLQDEDTISTLVVYERKGGLTEEDKATALADVKELQELEGVSDTVLGPQFSDDGEIAQTLIDFNFGANGWEELPDARDAIHGVVDVDDGPKVYVAGQGGQAADSATAFAGLDTRLLLAAAGVVVVLLLFTYRSPILWLLPLISVVTALFCAQGIIYLLVKTVDLTVNGQSYGILTVLVFGAGTDYALLLVARYREELRRHEDRHEAMAFALHRATPAVIASAATVALGMLCLLFAEMNSTAGLGPIAAIGIVVTLLVMITLLPALLVILGRWIFWPLRPDFGSDEPSAHGMWAKVGRWIKPRPRMVWVVTALILAVACIGWLKLDANGLTTEESYTEEFESVSGMKVLADHGFQDQSTPLLVVANADQADAVVKALGGVEGVAGVEKPQTAGDLALISAPTSDDPTSPAAFETVDRARDAVHTIRGADALVGGGSAFLRDVDSANNHDNRLIIPIVLLVVLLILMVLLRALVSPIVLILTVVLSYGAAMGISALIFHYIFGFEGADASLPLFSFVFLVALGIDYNIFLMTRVREETHDRGTREGSLVALAATGGVITSAGLVLAATFLMLGTMPLVFFAELGVAVALGVILDTFIVRSVLVTALNLDIGGRIWWPSKLDNGQPDALELPKETAGEAS